MTEHLRAGGSRPHSWPLVGRDEELSFAEAALDNSSVDGLVLSGMAGVGKTRLAREVCRLAEFRDFNVSWAVATQSASEIPFGALAHLLPPRRLPGLSPATGPNNVLGQVGEALLGPIANDPQLLAIDDAHLLDRSSAAVLRYLVASPRIFVLVSMRTGEDAPDAVDSLWKEEVPRVEIQPLSRRETEELIQAVLGYPVEASTLHRLWEATRGRPLLVREIVLGGLESKALIESEGVWVWRGSIASSPRVTQIVESRLRSLRSGERRALEIVAVAEHLEVAILEELAGTGVVDSLERRGFLEVEQGGNRIAVMLAHPLHGEVLRQNLTLSNGRDIRRLLISALESFGTRRTGDLLRATRWKVEAGRPIPPAIALKAARDAAQTFDFGLAEMLALQIDDVANRASAREVLAQALMGQGRYLEADRVLAELELAAVSDTALARIASMRAWNQFWHLDGGAEARTILEAAERSTADPDAWDELAITMANVLLFQGRVRQATDVIEDVRKTRDLSPNGLVGLALVGAPVYFMSGQVAKAKEILDLSTGLTTATQSPESGILLEGNRCITEMWAGNLDLAVDSLEDLYRSVVEAGLYPLRGMFAFLLGMCLLEKGLSLSGLHRLQEARAVLAEIDPLRHMPACLAETAYALALLGRVTEAEHALELAERRRLSSFSQDLFYLRRGQWWTAASRGERSRAAQIALETADSTGANGQLTQQARALHDAARLGAGREATDALVDIRGDTDSPLILAYADHAQAIRDRDPEGYQAVSRRFEEIGAYLYAAESAAATARLYDEAGLRGRSMAAASRARALCARCEGARTPVMDEAEFSLPLTPRQHEVATLAAQGQSNREIADRLVISLRTVENHLHNVYSELGISSRSELLAILKPNSRQTSELN